MTDMTDIGKTAIAGTAKGKCEVSAVSKIYICLMHVKFLQMCENRIVKTFKSIDIQAAPTTRSAS